MYYVYIIRCADRTLYTGITVDVARRVREHNMSPRGARYTRSRRPVSLVYTKRYRNQSTASQAENHIKQLTRGQKLRLIRH